MKIFMSYLIWLVLVPVDILSGALAVILAPFVVPFRKDNHLPAIFRWMETYDNPLQGDRGHLERWTPIVNMLSKYKLKSLGDYLQIVAWLWRNKAYNLAYYQLGRSVPVPAKMYGNPNTASSREDYVFGYIYCVAADGTWGLFLYKPWLTIGKFTFCIRIFIGWKIKGNRYWDYPADGATPPNSHEHAMMAFHINPFRYSYLRPEDK